ncbi:hypothetical protein BACCIP111899_01590 [Bacillus rhizoplanae]|uniref:Uncharacterized protein n=1 Tax=Bacillus rhizoplanae TaxID=2880966 RepID=A0ABM8Y9L2_9BACI|nr:hypothetical protein [Bacillus rhizoplanae]CAG9612414.1 hypothetical protein BACCIP111899_01590 [Bacillus rhizoplanae]
MNRPLATMNVQSVEDTEILAIVLYDGNGQRIEEHISLFEDAQSAVEALNRMLAFNGIFESIEVWCGRKDIYMTLLATEGVQASFRHSSDLTDGLYLVQSNRQILIEHYGLKPLSKWKRVILACLKKLEMRLKGEMNNDRSYEM